MRPESSSNDNDLPAELIAILASPHPATETVDTEGILARVHAQRSPGRTSMKPATYIWRYVSIAAVLIVCAVAVKYIPGISNQVDAPQSRTYVTAAGQTTNITLPSGARIILAPATTMRLSGNVADLNGEAAFIVTHSDKTPFIVRTKISTVRVLGTSFAVRAYEQDKDVRVVVESGKVAVGGAAVLGAGDVAHVTSARKVNVVHNTDVASLLSWRTGVLVFNNERVADVIPQLARWYNVPIRLTNSSIGELRITATFRSRSVVNLVAALEGALEVEAEWQGRVLILRPR